MVRLAIVDDTEYDRRVMQRLIAEFEKDQMELEDGDMSFSAFLQNVSLSTDMDNSDDSENKVTMMTIHNAKGLEFPCVFIVGFEEGIFPSGGVGLPRGAPPRGRP